MTDLVRQPALDLEQWAIHFRSVYNVAKVIAETPFAPPAMRDAATCCSAIMYGVGLGLDPMTAVGSIHVVDGRPGLSAEAMRGLTVAQGHEVELIEASDTRVVMRGRRKGSDRWQEVTWTMDRAKKAGLDQRPNYKKYPQQMLTARASSELCRLVAPDVLMGCPYSTEELSDDAPPGVVYNIDTGQPEAAAAKPRNERRVMQRAPLAAVEPPLDEPAPAPETPAEPAPAAPAEPEPVASAPVEQTVPGDDRIHDNTRRAIMASFNDAGIKDRTTRMGVVVELVGRHVDSVNQLSEPEARSVIDAVKNRPRALPKVPASTPATNDEGAYDWPELGGA